MATKLSTSASVLLFSAITVAVVSVAQAVLGFTQWFASAPAAVLSIHATLAQVALGEMAIVAAHIVVGLLFLLAAVALATLARKRVLTA